MSPPPSDGLLSTNLPPPQPPLAGGDDGGEYYSSGSDDDDDDDDAGLTTANDADAEESVTSEGESATGVPDAPQKDKWVAVKHIDPATIPAPVPNSPE